MLRNCIERLFGIIKNKFRVLQSPLRTNLSNTDYVFEYNDTIACVLFLFNFLKHHERAAIVTANNLVASNVSELQVSQEPDSALEDTSEGTALRDRIANECWQQYKRQQEQQAIRTHLEFVDVFINKCILALN